MFSLILENLFFLWPVACKANTIQFFDLKDRNNDSELKQYLELNPIRSLELNSSQNWNQIKSKIPIIKMYVTEANFQICESTINRRSNCVLLIVCTRDKSYLSIT